MGCTNGKSQAKQNRNKKILKNINMKQSLEVQVSPIDDQKQNKRENSKIDLKNSNLNLRQSLAPLQTDFKKNREQKVEAESTPIKILSCYNENNNQSQLNGSFGIYDDSFDKKIAISYNKNPEIQSKRLISSEKQNAGQPVSLLKLFNQSNNQKTKNEDNADIIHEEGTEEYGQNVFVNADKISIEFPV